ncbi:MAG TPA: nuclear transport factor 2 family protein [Thermoleophilaceae bacterium]
MELVQQAYDAFNRRDLGALLALVDADVHLVPQLAAMEGEYHGHEGARRWWENLLDAWPDYEATVVEIRDLGTVTLAKVQVGGHAVDSGIEVRETFWHVWRWRGNQAVWFAVFPTEAGALGASARGAG